MKGSFAKEVFLVMGVTVIREVGITHIMEVFMAVTGFTMVMEVFVMVGMVVSIIGIVIQKVIGVTINAYSVIETYRVVKVQSRLAPGVVRPYALLKGPLVLRHRRGRTSRQSPLDRYAARWWQYTTWRAEVSSS